VRSQVTLPALSRSKFSHVVGSLLHCAKDWVGSHPSLVPCDVGTHVAASHWVQTAEYASEFSWSYSPRTPIIDPNWEFPRVLKRMLRHNASGEVSSELSQQYFLLRGLIYRWNLFYGKFADENSWTWRWFPGGMQLLSEVRSR
jgi:hypothetical protein